MKPSPHGLLSPEDSGIWEKCFPNSKTVLHTIIAGSGDLSTYAVQHANNFLTFLESKVMMSRQ